MNFFKSGFVCVNAGGRIHVITNYIMNSMQKITNLNFQVCLKSLNNKFLSTKKKNCLHAMLPNFLNNYYSPSSGRVVRQEKNARLAKLKTLLNIGHELRKVYKLHQNKNQARIDESKPHNLAGPNYFLM